MTLSIYLASHIQKSHGMSSHLLWTNHEERLLKEQLAPLQLTFLINDLSDQTSIFGRNMAMIYCSDLVIVDARERRELELGAEMLFAKTHHIPVITWVSSEGHYYKKAIKLLGMQINPWTHPFIESLSDLIVTDLAATVSWIKDLSNQTIKGVGSIDEAMYHYMQKQFTCDLPMPQLAKNNSSLKERLDNLNIET